MSQNSATSYSFQPINSDNGQNDSNNTPSSSRIDKKVASIKCLQSNADILGTSIQVVDEVNTSNTAIRVIEYSVHVSQRKA